MNRPQDDRDRRFFGKFRGTVVDNLDPEQAGRLLASVPAVSSSPLNWALPCVPYAGPSVGFHFIPPVGANVWIEFEGGNPNYPIWVGCFWSPGELPAEAAEGGPDMKMIATESNTLMLDGTPEVGGIRAASQQPAIDRPDTATITPN